MFGRRADGRRVKDIMGVEKAMGYFMPTRNDATNLYTQDIQLKYLDEFIRKERQESGVHFSYTEIILAAAVRMLALRPKLNRFVVNCQTYQRNEITITMNVKPKLVDECDEIMCKFHFTGRENIYEIKEIVNAEIQKNIATGSDTNTDQGTNNTVKFLNKLPYWVYGFAVRLLRFMDKFGLIPKKLIDVSPFHTSMYITDIRSIKLDKVYHHIYNFGTTTNFVSIGKIKKRAYFDADNNMSVEKVIQLGMTQDERVCDGLYNSNSLRKFFGFLQQPDILKESLPAPELTAKEKKKAQKQEKKEAKRKAKLERKQLKTAA